MAAGGRPAFSGRPGRPRRSSGAGRAGASPRPGARAEARGRGCKSGPAASGRIRPLLTGAAARRAAEGRGGVRGEAGWERAPGAAAELPFPARLRGPARSGRLAGTQSFLPSTCKGSVRARRRDRRPCPPRRRHRGALTLRPRPLSATAGDSSTAALPAPSEAPGNCWRECGCLRAPKAPSSSIPFSVSRGSRKVPNFHGARNPFTVSDGNPFTDGVCRGHRSHGQSLNRAPGRD